LILDLFDSKLISYVGRVVEEHYKAHLY
jgi:hypothetical protein